MIAPRSNYGDTALNWPANTYSTDSSPNRLLSVTLGSCMRSFTCDGAGNIEGYSDPRNETARRKPEKVGDSRLEKAK